MIRSLNKRIIRTSILVLAGLLICTFTVTGASTTIPVVTDSTIQARAALAYGNNTVYVAWAGNHQENNNKVYLSVKNLSDGGFGVANILRSDNDFIYYPPKVDIDSNGDPIVVWSEQDTTLVDQNLRNIQESDNGQLRMIAQDICSPYPDPDVTVGTSRVHVVFAATMDCQSATLTDLYYTSRNINGTTWSAPIKIADRNDANPGLSLSDKIRYPRVVVNSSDTVVSVVWEQMISGKPSVWYTTGYGTSWNTGTRVSEASAESEQNAVYPSIAIDGSDRIHIAWTELVGSPAIPDYQNIHHRTFERTTSTQINFQRVLVTDNIPTRAISDITAYGNYICVAWYSYDEDTPDSVEDVLVRCSNDAGQESWSMIANISDSADWLSPYPSLAIDNQFEMHVVWSEYAISDLEYEPIGLYYNAQTAEYGDVYHSYFPMTNRATVP